MSEVTAWLLDLGHGLHAAVGEREIIHVLPDPPPMFEIPRSPAYCRRLLIWQDELLPLMNLAGRVTARPVAPAEAQPGDDGLVAIAAFQRHPGEAPRHGGLLLRGTPSRVGVSDANACGLPEAPGGWRQFAISCFEHADLGPVPVLDLQSVFS
jgi:chemotaxis signal transduction protein